MKVGLRREYADERFPPWSAGVHRRRLRGDLASGYRDDGDTAPLAHRAGAARLGLLLARRALPEWPTLRHGRGARPRWRWHHPLGRADLRRAACAHPRRELWPRRVPDRA